MSPLNNRRQTTISSPDSQAASGNLCFTIGSYLLITLTAFFCGELILSLMRNRPFHIFLILCLLSGGLTGFFVPRKFSAGFSKKILRTVWVVIIITSAVFTLHNRLPISMVSITLRRAPDSANFSLRQSIESPRKTFMIEEPVSPGQGPVTIHLNLPVAIRNTCGPLTIYFGRAPNSYDILRISYDTQVLFEPLPLHTFSGKALLRIAKTTKALNSLDMVDGAARLSSKGHSRPMLDLMSDKDYIRSNTPTHRILVIKLLWFFLYTVMPALIIRYGRKNWSSIPYAQAVMRYFTQ